MLGPITLKENVETSTMWHSLDSIPSRGGTIGVTTPPPFLKEQTTIVGSERVKLGSINKAVTILIRSWIVQRQVG
ncbi:hypothetical protein [Synechococcus sp. MIT S1220]|uniref:hypothetical protein n=1 Tax=Synechococcus sp. MIT S1220 TaxID=3082549 RepID=UPI0039AF3B7E